MSDSDKEAETLSLPAWGHRAGILSLGDAVRPDDPGSALDRALICERIARYCWSYDERRLDLLAGCFTEDGVWEGNVLGEIPIGPFEGRAAIANWLSEFWPHQHDQRRHMLLNTIVEAQEAQSARTLSYLLLMSSNGASISMESMGFYRISYRRCGEHWRIERLTAGFDKPFWPGDIKKMSQRGRARHGVTELA